MDAQLNRKCLEILHAGSVKEFSQHLVDFTHSLNLHTVAATVVTDHSSSLTEFQSVTNAPAGYLSAFEDLDAGKRDPVSQHCKRFSSSVAWNQDFYVANGRGDFWEHQATFGYQSGISVAFHLPRGRHFMFGVDSHRRACGTEKELRDMAAYIHVFAGYAQAAAFDLCIPYDQGVNRTTLAKGELEALRWSMDGLSDWEVGRELAISETEVTLRLRRSMLNLRCANKYETALRAIRLGLIVCD
jgi:DNA-binding CsgD family transcriptional regulator